MIHGRTVSVELLAQMYAAQLTTKGEKHLLDRDRLYYRLLRQIARQGQDRSELRQDIPTGEIVKTYALCEGAAVRLVHLRRRVFSAGVFRENDAHFPPTHLRAPGIDKKLSDGI